MRFGTFVPQGWKGDQNGIPVEDQWNRILGFAELIEDSGYDSIWVYDHFHTHPVVAQESTFDAWSLMAALAAVTNRVRLLDRLGPVDGPVHRVMLAAEPGLVLGPHLQQDLDRLLQHVEALAGRWEPIPIGLELTFRPAGADTDVEAAT